MPKTVAIVEDDIDQRYNYAEELRRHGYKVIELASRKDASEKFSATPPDLIILDIILGDEQDGGFDLGQELLGKYPALPIILLTNRIEAIDERFGYRIGGDYMTKPIDLSVLSEKVKFELKKQERRNSKEPSKNKYEIGQLEVNDDKKQVKWGGYEVRLTNREYSLLLALTRPHLVGNVIEYNSLIDQMAGNHEDINVENNTVNTHIMNIRKKFKEVDPTFNMIENHSAIGYRWISD